ncbi:MAG: hypothetical protein PHO63_03300 [Bacilli bacterium]|nr:hypothetical protein [Bacilli bacterium]MDD4809136.1 hypothetical protein [Bacilli bacterium]
MKKILVILATITLLFVSGCVKVEEGDYKEGTYFASTESVSYGKTYTVTAVLYVNEDGVIKSLFLDNTYIKDDVISTKKALGDAYGMKETSANIGVIEGGAEWDEQINTLEDKIVSEQGLEWIKWSDEAKTKTDSVSGVTIAINDLYKVTNDVLTQAKK